MKTQVQVSNTMRKRPACPHIPITLTLWEAEAGGSLGLPGNQLRCQFIERICYKAINCRMIEQKLFVLLCPPYAHRHMDLHTHVCTHCSHALHIPCTHTYTHSLMYSCLHTHGHTHTRTTLQCFLRSEVKYFVTGT